MSFETNNFNVVKKCRLPKSEINLSCSVSAEGEISKIFAVSVAAYEESQEIIDGMVSFSGHVDVCMIYMLEDGGVGSAFSSCPFSSKFEDPSIDHGEKAIIKLKVVDHTIDAVNSSEATIGIRIEQSGLLISSAEIRSINSHDDDVCIKEDELTVVRFIGSGKSSQIETGEHSTRERVKKVLGSESCVLVKDVESGVNFVSVSGDVATRVLFVDENDKFDSVQIYDSFKEELEIEGVSRESLAEAVAKVNTSLVKIDVEDQDKGSKITVGVPFEITAYAYEEVSVNVVEDLYSLSSEMEISTESFNMSKQLALECVEGKIDGSLTIGDDQPRVDKILFTFGSDVEITNSYISDGELFLEGIAKTSVVYLNDESSSFNAVEIEVPFSISDKTKGTENSIISVEAILTDVDVAVKKGRELFFDGKVKAIVSLSDDTVSAVISEAKPGEAYAERDYAMQIVFAREGDSLWDVAKLNRVRESQIAYQNPGVVFPLTENKDIVIFYQNR